MPEPTSRQFAPLTREENMVTDDPYTVRARLCDDTGWVSDTPVEGEDTLDTSYLERHNRLRNESLIARGEKAQITPERFMCTGSAHLAGQHIRCTSPAHKPGPKPPPIAPGDTARWA